MLHPGRERKFAFPTKIALGVIGDLALRIWNCWGHGTPCPNAYPALRIFSSCLRALASSFFLRMRTFLGVISSSSSSSM